MEEMMNPGTAYFIRTHPNAVLPTFGSRLAACCDITLPETVVLNAGECKLVSTGFIAIPPLGWHWHIYLRSSAPIRYPGLILANCTGIIDSDYIGPNDNIKLILLNQNKNILLEIEQGKKIAQMRLVQNVRPKIEEITHAQAEFRRSRGGFGSTG